MFKRIKKWFEPKGFEFKKWDKPVNILPKDTQYHSIPLGDGEAVFIGQGSAEEYEQLQKEDSGMSPWYKRLKNL